MDQRTIQLFFALLRSAIRGTTLTDEEQSDYSPALLPELLKLASKHDVAHLLETALKKNELLEKQDTGIERYILKAVYRYEQINNTYLKLCETLENAQIPFLPLKGSVLRKYYPEAWMRTSCDIDILVHEEDLEKAVSLLVDEQGYASQGYTYNEKGAHDISLFAPNKIHLELHFTLIEDGLAKEASQVLKEAWNYTVIREGFTYWHEMLDEMFYFYHIAHMAKHFENGGCGVRPFIDLWILDGIKEANAMSRKELLAKGELSRFAEVAQKLSRIWFESEQYEPITRQMESYLLHGGVYGNYENRVFVQQQIRGGRLKYVISQIFLPYSKLKTHYPILEKYPWLTPFMEIRRWCKLIFGGHFKRVTKELKFDGNISKQEDGDAKMFIKNIGL